MDIKTLDVLPPWDWPPETSAFLHEVLTDRSAALADREAAAGHAGEIVAIDEQLVEDLLAIAADPSEPESLRARAPISLGPVLDQLDTAEFDDSYDEPPISEATFRKIKDSLRSFYSNDTFPKEVRRRILEASVRSPEDWHKAAIQAAYASGDREWVLTAVFAMRFVEGFPEQILESLKNPDPEIHGEAVAAAGTWELDAAWPHIRSLLTNRNTPKPLLLAAIEAAGLVGAEGALDLLEKFTKSKDAEIRDAAEQALEIPNFDEDGDEDEEEFIN